MGQTGNTIAICNCLGNYQVENGTNRTLGTRFIQQKNIYLDIPIYNRLVKRLPRCPDLPSDYAIYMMFFNTLTKTPSQRESKNLKKREFLI